MIVGRLHIWPVLQATWREWVGFGTCGVIAGLLRDIHRHPQDWGVASDAMLALTSWLAFPETSNIFAAVSALGGALAIFLSFRNSSAYGRWWEARKIWGALVNDSRSWTRQVISWIGDGREGDPGVIALRRELVYRHLAFVWGLAHHLRGLPVHGSVAPYLDEGERERLRAAPNVPTALLMHQGLALSRAEREGHVTHLRHLEMDKLLSAFSDVQGKCERIKNTPLPRQYEVIPRTFVQVYGCLLPFGLAPSVGWLCLPLGLLVGLLFDLLERSGRVIEDPFEDQPTDTPMFALATTIERDLRATLGETALPEPLRPDRQGVLM